MTTVFFFLHLRVNSIERHSGLRTSTLGCTFRINYHSFNDIHAKLNTFISSSTLSLKYKRNSSLYCDSNLETDETFYGPFVLRIRKKFISENGHLFWNRLIAATAAEPTTFLCINFISFVPVLIRGSV